MHDVERTLACSTPAGRGGKGCACAVLSPPGRGALAVVGVEGDGAIEAVARVFRPHGTVLLADRDDGSIVVGQWGEARACEELVVVRRSATSLEVHPHGGLAATQRVMSDLERSGCRRLRWDEWLSFSGRPTIEVEARVTLAAVGGPKAAGILARQIAPLPGGNGMGLLEGAFARVRRFIAEGRRSEAACEIDGLLDRAVLGLRLSRPWRVVVAGRPNAGKSSLVNAIAGFSRSLVSPEPGTTRDVLETRIVLDGWEVDLVDTAGLRDDAASPTELEGVARARGAAAAADLVLEVVEAAQPCAEAAAGRMLVRSKCDVLPAHASWPDGQWPTSAVTGEGIDRLASAIVRRLVPREPTPDEAIPFTARQVAELHGLSGGGLSAVANAQRGS